MSKIYKDIYKARTEGKKLLAILIDPEKFDPDSAPEFFQNLGKTRVTHIFVGGSTDEQSSIGKVIKEVKSLTLLPVLIFPGDENQIDSKADGLLFLSLISGRNPDYLIGKHVNSVSKLRGLNIEVIPTGYILVDGRNETAVERVSQTKPIDQNDLELTQNTARAGELLGMKLIYIEAGSGAKNPVSAEIITAVKSDISVPLIVGGGIKSTELMEAAYKAGADMVVIGNAFEENPLFINMLKS